MKLPGKVTIPDHVMARHIGDETVILDLASGTYFGLNPVGARMWQLIGKGHSLALVCDALLAEFEVSRDDLERDIARLVGDLRAQGLINVS